MYFSLRTIFDSQILLHNKSKYSMYSTLSGSIFGIFILFYLNENITSVSLGYSLFLSSSIILLTSVFLSPIKGVITKEIIITIFIYILISLFDKK